MGLAVKVAELFQQQFIMESPSAEEDILDFQPTPSEHAVATEKELLSVPTATSSKAQHAAWQQQNQQRKKAYLRAVQQQNAELVARIRKLDSTLDAQLGQIAARMIPRKPNKVPRLEQQQTAELRSKYQQLEKLKTQLELKRNGVDSLQFLVSQRTSLAIELQRLQDAVKRKKEETFRLKKAREKWQASDAAVKQEVIRVGQLGMFGDEIQQLRKEVQLKQQKIRASKEEFLNSHRKNRSALLLPKPEPLPAPTLDPQLQQMQLQYEALGKRVDILRAKKALLQHSQRQQAQFELQRVKTRFLSLSRLTK